MNIFVADAGTWGNVSQVVSAVVAVLAAGGGAVWFVSKVSATVDGLKDSMDRLSEAVNGINARVEKQNLRIDRLERTV